MHQGAADNITHLDAKTQYGRPAWNKIFKDVADKHKGWVGLYRLTIRALLTILQQHLGNVFLHFPSLFRTEIGVFFCGPSVLSHVLHKAANQHSDPSTGVKFSYNKENF